MSLKILLLVLLFTIVLCCKKSTEAEPEKNSITGTWILKMITDDLDNYISGSRGIDGVIVKMDLKGDGSGQVDILNGTNAATYSCNWNTSSDIFVINVDRNGELTHHYEFLSLGKQSQDEAPPGTSLVLSGSNQFAENLEISLVLYYSKN